MQHLAWCTVGKLMRGCKPALLSLARVYSQSDCQILKDCLADHCEVRTPNGRHFLTYFLTGVVVLIANNFLFSSFIAH